MSIKKTWMRSSKNIYNTAKDLINNWGMRNTADYITDCTYSSGACTAVTESRCQECI